MPTLAVIGAGPGIGLAIARRFMADGHGAALLSRRADPALAASLGPGATAHAVDAGDPKAVAAGLAAVEAARGPIDVLAYNAAAVTPRPPTALPVEQLIADFAVGVAGALAAVQAVAGGMAARGRGTILLTGGGFANRPMAQLASLGIQKAALRNLALSLAEELGPKGIRVGTVTVLGMVKPGTAFDPDRIAEAFHALHVDRTGTLGVELPFTGS